MIVLFPGDCLEGCCRLGFGGTRDGGVRLCGITALSGAKASRLYVSSNRFMLLPVEAFGSS